jgi:hypothetical protein
LYKRKEGNKKQKTKKKTKTNKKQSKNKKTKKQKNIKVTTWVSRIVGPWTAGPGLSVHGPNHEKIR